MKKIFILSFLLFSIITQAAFEVREFKSEKDKERYYSMIEELRCPKCDNQNLESSNAPIAKDLRDYIFKNINDGKNDSEILSELISRYGEFVSYNPKFNKETFLLWVIPVLIFIVGLITILYVFFTKKEE